MEFWDTYADKYEQNIEVHGIPVNYQLYALTRAYKAAKIIETGVGAGLASQMFTTGLLRPGGTYVGIDISSEMIAKISKRLHKVEQEGQINFDFETFKPKEGEKMDLKALDGGDHTSKTKKVFVGEANSENLPFSDGQFDVYISNFSLNIVDDYEQMLAEASRVSLRSLTIHRC